MMNALIVAAVVITLSAGGSNFSISQWVLEHTYDEVRIHTEMYGGATLYDLDDMGCGGQADPDGACDDGNPCTVDYCWVHRSALLGGSRDTCVHVEKFCSREEGASCRDGLDNDRDGLTDCEDQQCKKDIYWCPKKH